MLGFYSGRRVGADRKRGRGKSQTLPDATSALAYILCRSWSVSSRWHTDLLRRHVLALDARRGCVAELMGCVV